MKKHPIAILSAAMLATATLYPAPAFADHRPGNVVVIGGTLSLTGRYVEPAGRIHSGRKMFWDELNARGGLLGHKVELRILDDKSDVQTAIRIYKKLFTEGKVDLVLGPRRSIKEEGSTFSAIRSCPAPIAKKARFTSPSKLMWSGSPSLFRPALPA